MGVCGSNSKEIKTNTNKVQSNESKEIYFPKGRSFMFGNKDIKEL